MMRTSRLLTLVFSALAVIFAFASVAEAKRVEIIVSKIGQKMTVKVDGDTEYVWPVSTGAAKYETPTGTYKPFRMEADHFSKEWDDAPMPHSIFFTGEGHAIHGSFHVKSLGRKASHGCVRLAPENAAILFDLVKDAGLSNTTVTIKGGLLGFGNFGMASSSDTGAPKRSWWQVNKDIEKVTKPDAKKPAAKKVAAKCTVKDGKKVCKKPFTLFGGSNG